MLSNDSHLLEICFAHEATQYEAIRPICYKPIAFGPSKPQKQKKQKLNRIKDSKNRKKDHLVQRKWKHFRKNHN